MNELTLSTALETALNRIEDMLSDYDGQAFKEARKFLPVGRDALAALRSMPAEPVALVCDICGVETQDPWHYSEGNQRHLHACDKCQQIKPAQPADQSQFCAQCEAPGASHERD